VKVAAVQAKAQAHAETLRDIVDEIRNAGITSAYEISAELNSGKSSRHARRMASNIGDQTSWETTSSGGLTSAVCRQTDSMGIA
jgi:hypothetical protein